MNNIRIFKQWIKEEYLNRKDAIEEIHNVTSEYKYTVFYGCGLNIYNILETWRKYIDRKIDFCCDRDPAKWGKSFAGIKCISPDELINIKDECAVFITCANRIEAYDFLNQHKFNFVSEISRYDLISTNVMRHLDSNIFHTIEKVFDCLADEKSKEIFKSCFIRKFNPLTKNFIMSSFNENNTYFPDDVIELTHNESFVDAGAYNGDTLESFLKKVDNSFHCYYAFELDKKTYKKLLYTIEQIAVNDKIFAFNQGLWNKNDTVFYNSCEEDSSICENGEGGVVVALDDKLANHTVTFIKMDIEGSELNALKGAANIIKIQKPKLAICIYHKLEDLWEIPLYILSLAPEYKFYIRHHSNYDYETVLYAIPGI